MLDVLKKIEIYLGPLLRSNESRGASCLWHRVKYKVAAFLLPVVLCSQIAGAQELSIDNQVDALLSEIQSQQETRAVYNVIDGFKVADVSVAYPFKTIERRGDWRLVRFNVALVTGWVSADYVTINDGMATVNASNLNVRIDPVATARVITTVPRSYQGKVEEQRDDFVRIFLPSDRYFAIKNESASSELANGQGSSNSEPRELNQPPTNLNVKEVESTVQNRAATGADETAAGLFKKAGLSKADEQLTERLGTERLHKISPGDAISLLVFGEQDLSIQNVRVPQSGRVSFPLIGSVLVAGKTTDQVEQSVAELLSQGYVRNPRLSVTIFSYRPIFIRGAVRETGSYPFTEGLTIAKAIALAGGSKNSAKLGGVSVSRDGQLVQQGLNIDSEVEVSSGDVISIAEEVGVSEDAASYIYLHGEVPSPGEYLYRRGLTVEKAIVLAGGFTIRASRKKISVTRYAEQDESGKPKRLKRVKLYEPIEPGDVIVVGASLF